MKIVLALLQDGDGNWYGAKVELPSKNSRKGDVTGLWQTNGNWWRPKKSFAYVNPVSTISIEDAEKNLLKGLREALSRTTPDEEINPSVDVIGKFEPSSTGYEATNLQHR